MSRRFTVLLASLVTLHVGCECGGSQTSRALGEIGVEPAWLDYGTAVIGTLSEKELVVSSTGTASVSVSEVVIVGEQASAFELLTTGLTALPGGATGTVRVRFRPEAEGVYAAHLLVRSDAHNSHELAVSLAGRAVPYDPCLGVACDQAPGVCFMSQGSCVNGQCRYSPSPQDTLCEDQNPCTVSDRCGASGECLGSARLCQTPPDAGCLDADTRRSYEALGVCGADGGCSYRSVTEPCLLGCQALTGECRAGCEAGLHLCDALCVSDDDPATCGNSCSPCPAPANATALCISGQCDFACDPGLVQCGSGCCQPATLRAVSLGAYHSCVLTSAQAVKCWGRNDNGQLGMGLDGGVFLDPMAVVGLSFGVTSLSVHSQHSCAVQDDGGVRCWGHNAVGRLGVGDNANRNSPTPVVGLSGPASAVFASGLHSCVLLASGGVQCFGDNLGGGLGDPAAGTSSSSAIEPVGLSSGVTAVFRGRSHTCVRQLGTLKCWGDNYNGQIGTGSQYGNLSTPTVPAALPSSLVELEGGYAHSCGVTATGGARCWGQNYAGQLGNGLSANVFTPVDVVGLGSGVAKVVVGQEFGCALTTAGGVKCWGKNDVGQLGNATNVGSSVPVDVQGLSSGVVGVWAGLYHACALTSAGALRCWGHNQYGQLGNKQTAHSPVPVDVQGL